jgi:hypothetical protein
VQEVVDGSGGGSSEGDGDDDDGGGGSSSCTRAIHTDSVAQPAMRSPRVLHSNVT